MSYPKYEFEYNNAGQITYAPKVSDGLYISLSQDTEQEISIPDSVNVIVATETAGIAVVFSEATIVAPTQAGAAFKGNAIIGKTELYPTFGTANRKLYLKCAEANNVILNFYS